MSGRDDYLGGFAEPEPRCERDCCRRRRAEIGPSLPFTEPPGGGMPTYEERAEQLLREAARLISVLRAPCRDAQLVEDAERWFERYGLHGSQVDHPDLREDEGEGTRPTPVPCPPFEQVTFRMDKFWFGEKHGWLTHDEALAAGFTDPVNRVLPLEHTGPGVTGHADPDDIW